jgi:hypothetical protein
MCGWIQDRGVLNVPTKIKLKPASVTTNKGGKCGASRLPDVFLPECMPPKDKNMKDPFAQLLAHCLCSPTQNF